MEESRVCGVGVCAIGRNEGERLERCLKSLLDGPAVVVYVDSGSSDGSAARARDLGVQVIELDPGPGFTAARARNAGFEALITADPAIEFVQFVDGDSELRPGWIDEAVEWLQRHAEIGAVCGALVERHPDASIYNRLAALEWRLPPGETDACGGIALFRASVFRALEGFRIDMIAGEEPELCYRMRRAGYGVVRLDLEMAIHDAAMSRFAQWWRRAVRAGHSFAESALLHGREDARWQTRELASIALWGGALPLVSIGFLWPTSGLSGVLLLAYASLWWRVYRHRLGAGDPPEDARLYACGATLGKFPEALGVARFGWTRLVRGTAPRLIEYKGRP